MATSSAWTRTGRIHHGTLTTIVFLDAFPEPTYEVAVAEPITRGTYRIPYDPRERGFAVARDATGALRVFATG